MSELTEKDAAALEVRPSARKHLRQVPLLAAFLAYYVAGGLTGFLGARLALAGGTLFGVVILIGLGLAVRASRAPWEMRLDGDGMTIRGHDRVSWSDISEVRLSRLKPRWFWAPRFFPRFLRSDDGVVSFVPAPGVDLPPLPSVAGRGAWGRLKHRRLQRSYDTQLVVALLVLDPSVEEILAAVERWSDVPVR